MTVKFPPEDISDSMRTSLHVFCVDGERNFYFSTMIHGTFHSDAGMYRTWLSIYTGAKTWIFG